MGRKESNQTSKQTIKTYVWELNEMVLLSAQNICFNWKVRKKIILISFYLTATMKYTNLSKIYFNTIGLD